MNISNLPNEEMHKAMIFRERRRRGRKKAQCLMFIERETSNRCMLPFNRIQWAQLSLTVALSMAILYSIQSANEHISSYLNYHFPSHVFVSLLHTHIQIFHSFFLRYFLFCFCLFVTSLPGCVCVFFIGLCLLFNLNTCIRYDWFVMCIWFVFPFVVSPHSRFQFCVYVFFFYIYWSENWEIVEPNARDE